MSKSKNIIAQNKKAKFNYEIIEKIEAGVVLNGPEVKAVRDGKVAIDNSYAVIKINEIWVLNLNIDTKKYDTGTILLKSIRPKNSY